MTRSPGLIRSTGGWAKEYVLDQVCGVNRWISENIRPGKQAAINKTTIKRDADFMGSLLNENRKGLSKGVREQIVDGFASVVFDVSCSRAGEVRMGNRGR